MISIFVLLSLFGIGIGHQEFQCEFEDENLKLSKKDDAKFVWSNKEVEPLAFEDLNDLALFLWDLNEMRQQLYRENIYNDFDSFVNDYTEARKDGMPLVPEKLDEFIEEYVPPVATSQDTLGLLVKYFRELEVQMPEVKSHYFLALKGVGIKPEVLQNIYQNNHNTTTTGFEYNSLIGLLKLSYAGEIGYAIINVDYPENTIPVILENDGLPPSQRKEKEAFKKYVEEIFPYTNNRLPVIYFFVGPNNEFIQNNRLEKTKAGFYRTTEIHAISTKPLCSVVKVQNQMNMQTTVFRSMIKYAPNFRLKAYVYARVPHPSSVSDARESRRPMFNVVLFLNVPTDEEYYAAEAQSVQKQEMMEKLEAEMNGQVKEGKEEEHEEEVEENEVENEVDHGVIAKSIEFDHLYQLSEDGLEFLEEVGNILKVNLQEKIMAIAQVIQMNFGKKPAESHKVVIG